MLQVVEADPAFAEVEERTEFSEPRILIALIKRDLRRIEAVLSRVTPSLPWPNSGASDETTTGQLCSEYLEFIYCHWKEFSSIISSQKHKVLHHLYQAHNENDTDAIENVEACCSQLRSSLAELGSLRARLSEFLTWPRTTASHDYTAAEYRKEWNGISTSLKASARVLRQVMDAAVEYVVLVLEETAHVETKRTDCDSDKHKRDKVETKAEEKQRMEKKASGRASRSDFVPDAPTEGKTSPRLEEVGTQPPSNVARQVSPRSRPPATLKRSPAMSSNEALEELRKALNQEKQRSRQLEIRLDEAVSTTRKVQEECAADVAEMRRQSHKQADRIAKRERKFLALMQSYGSRMSSLMRQVTESSPSSVERNGDEDDALESLRSVLLGGAVDGHKTKQDLHTCGGGDELWKGSSRSREEDRSRPWAFLMEHFEEPLRCLEQQMGRFLERVRKQAESRSSFQERLATTAKQRERESLKLVVDHNRLEAQRLKAHYSAQVGTLCRQLNETEESARVQMSRIHEEHAKEVALLRSNHDDCLMQLQDATEVKAAYESQVKALEGSLYENQSRTDDLELLVCDLRNQIQSLRESVDLKNSELSGCQERVRVLEGALAAARHDVQSTAAIRERHEKRIHELRASFDEKLQEIRGEYEDRVHHFTRLSRDFANERERGDQKAVEAVREQYERLVALLRKELSVLRAEAERHAQHPTSASTDLSLSPTSMTPACIECLRVRESCSAQIREEQQKREHAVQDLAEQHRSTLTSLEQQHQDKLAFLTASFEVEIASIADHVSTHVETLKRAVRGREDDEGDQDLCSGTSPSFVTTPSSFSRHSQLHSPPSSSSFLLDVSL